MATKEEPLEFRLLMARLEHQKRMIARYKQSEEWENLQEGDPVIIDNRDSLHDGQRGSFIAHDWSVSGYVRLIVAFSDGKKCYYLPTQVALVYDEPIEPEPKTAPVPVPEAKGIDHSKMSSLRDRTEEDLTADNLAFIDSKLSRVAKMPPSTRKKVLMGTLPPVLVDRAVKIGIERGILTP
jgi:hypothetical protein